MILKHDNLKEFESKGYNLPKFDIEKVRTETYKNPVWLHFGAGNIFRAFPAQKQQDLLNSGFATKGIIVAEAFDEEIIESAFTPFDNLTINVSLKGDGAIEKTIVASITESLPYSTSYDRLVEICTNPSLEMISLTITEKGYSTQDSTGNLLGYIANDLKNFEKPTTMMGILTRLLFERFTKNQHPITLVSMDNCSHNGTLLQNGILTFAEIWNKENKVSNEYVAYLKDQKKCAFTWSMIDKITPRPSELVENILIADGFAGGKIIKTAKNTFVSSFVNAEECEYLAIEDAFTNGRQALEKAEVMFADRETIDKIEKMKVCTCLNPLHTALAVFGCLLGFDSISSEMKDKTMKTLVEKIGYVEGMPVVVDPIIMSAEKFIDQCINKRFPNPFVPDTPQRIACDTSKKLPVRFGETLKAYIATGKTDLSFMKYIPLVFAGWARYLMGVDDDLNTFELSPDPNLEVCCKFVANIKIGANNDLSPLKNLFRNEEIFGVNLFDYNLGETVMNYFKDMTEGKGAIRKTLERVLEI